MANFNRLESVIDSFREQDRNINECTCLKDIELTFKTANYFNIRQLVLNTAIIADVLDRLGTDHTDLSVDDLLKMMGDV